MLLCGVANFQVLLCLSCEMRYPRCREITSVCPVLSCFKEGTKEIVCLYVNEENREALSVTEDHLEAKNCY